jgi:hypothetical protein
MLIVKPIEYIYGKLNALRLHRQRWWLRVQWIELGENVYLGEHVDIQRAADSRLKICNEEVFWTDEAKIAHSDLSVAI